ncbi:DUF6477 family protein [Mangrovicoccus ximenensis]|uniref:DUF6477 family protein n=1 Tax=Mangrovicoccus ximenensis TaxID=1911570 RepID=UPI001375330E|nr:DUF6477 family protein [Mangrovicoccus ximenensis]
MQLVCLEQGHEEARRAGLAAYSPARHLEVLIALLSEARTILAESQERSPAAAPDLRIA